MEDVIKIPLPAESPDLPKDENRKENPVAEESRCFQDRLESTLLDDSPGSILNLLDYIANEEGIEGVPGSIKSTHLKWMGNFDYFDLKKGEKVALTDSDGNPTPKFGKAEVERHGKFWNDCQHSMFDPTGDRQSYSTNPVPSTLRDAGSDIQQKVPNSRDTNSEGVTNSMRQESLDNRSPLHKIPSIVSDQPVFMPNMKTFRPVKPGTKLAQKRQKKVLRKLPNKRQKEEFKSKSTSSEDEEGEEFLMSNFEKVLPSKELPEWTPDPKQEELTRYKVNAVLSDRYDPETTISTTYLGSKAGKYTPLFKRQEIQLNEKLHADGEVRNQPVRILFDTGASVSLISSKFVENNPAVEIVKMPPQRIVIGDGTSYILDKGAKVVVTIQDHSFEIIAWVTPMSPSLEMVFGAQSMLEVEGVLYMNTQRFSFMNRTSPVRAPYNLNINNGRNSEVFAVIDEVPPGLRKTPIISKLKLPSTSHFETVVASYQYGRAMFTITTEKQTNLHIPAGTQLGIVDYRSVGYFYVAHSGLHEYSSLHYFFMKCRSNNMSLKEQELHTAEKVRPKKPKPKGKRVPDSPDYNPNFQSELKIKESEVEVKPGKRMLNGFEVDADDPYPWLEPDDIRRTMTDEQIIRTYIKLDEVSSRVTPELKEKIYALLLKYREALSLRDEIGVCKDMEVELELKDESPFYKTPYSMDQQGKKYVDKESRRGCLLGIMRKGLTPHCSPIMLIPRPSGVPRIVTDFRFLNSRLKLLQCSLPLMRDAIQNLGQADAEIASILDLRDAFHTLRVTARSQKFLGVMPYFGSQTYVYQRMPMGLSISPAIFMFFITKVMNELEHRDNYIAIVDDILVHSKFDDHLDRLEDLLKVLIKNGLKISPKKAQLFREKVTYMGIEISYEKGHPTMRPTKSKVEAIQKITALETIQDVRSFCGMVNFIQMFVKNIQFTLDPIYKLLKKNREFKWTKECQEALDKIKEQLSSDLVLTLPNSTGKFTLVSDTSKIATGSALYQEQDGEMKLIAYHSKRLNPAAERYSISELELHGLFINIKAFDHYLRGVPFKAVVDHSALVYIMSASKEPPTLRLKKLVEKLSEYQCQVEFLKGEQMFISDFLSRHVGNEKWTEEVLPVSLFNSAVHCSLSTPELRDITMWVAAQEALHRPVTRSQTAKLLQGEVNPHSRKRRQKQPRRKLEEPQVEEEDLSPEAKQLAEKHASPRSEKRRLELKYEGYIPPHDDPNDHRKPEEILFREPKPLWDRDLTLADIMYKHLPKQSELTKHLEDLNLKVIHNYDLPLSLKELVHYQQKDPFFGDIYNYLQNNNIRKGKTNSKLQEKLRTESQDYVMVNTVLMRLTKFRKKGLTLQLCVPQDYIPSLLYQYHDSLMAAHQGIGRMYNTLREKYYAPYLFDNIRKYVQCCHACQIEKPNEAQTTSNFVRIPTDYRPMRYVSMDIKNMPTDELGYTSVLFCVCDFTNYVVAVPLKRATAESILDALLNHIVFTFGPPERIIADQGAQFLAKLTQETLSSLKTRIQFVSPGNHGSLRAERYIQTISRGIKKQMLARKDTKWSKLVQPCCYAHNVFKQEVLQGYSPYELVFLHEPRPLSDLAVHDRPEWDLSPSEYLKEKEQQFQKSREIVLNEKQAEQIKHREKAKRMGLQAHVYIPGDLVYYYAPRLTDLQVDSQKFKAHWIGPLQIKQILDKTHMLLADINGKELKFLGSVHTNLLKPCLLHFGKMKGNHLMTISSLEDVEALLGNFHRVL